MNTLEETIFKTILDNAYTSDVLRERKTAKACTTITIEFASNFRTWCDKDAELYICEANGNDKLCYCKRPSDCSHRRYFTTDELITTYINTLK